MTENNNASAQIPVNAEMDVRRRIKAVFTTGFLV